MRRGSASHGSAVARHAARTYRSPVRVRVRAVRINAPSVAPAKPHTPMSCKRRRTDNRRDEHLRGERSMSTTLPDAAAPMTPIAPMSSPASAPARPVVLLAAEVDDVRRCGADSREQQDWPPFAAVARAAEPTEASLTQSATANMPTQKPSVADATRRAAARRVDQPAAAARVLRTTSRG